MCTHSTIVSYILCILSCTMCLFRFVRSPFLLFCYSKKNSAPLKRRQNWCQPPLPATRIPSRANGGAPVPSASPQPLIHLHCLFPTGSILIINHAKPDPPSHFLPNMPSAVSPTRPSKPFSNRHAKPSPVRQSRHSSSDYLPLQAISEPTCQAKR